MAKYGNSNAGTNSGDVVSTRTSARANSDRLAKGWLIMLAVLMAAVAMQHWAG